MFFARTLLPSFSVSLCCFLAPLTVFLRKCTSKKHAIPELSFFQAVRVCNSCHVVLSNPKGLRPASAWQSHS